ncbi:MAG: GAF domain-containing sensor histidine kinase [Thermodesulfobacteriota bacterium]
MANAANTTGWPKESSDFLCMLCSGLQRTLDPEAVIAFALDVLGRVDFPFQNNIASIFLYDPEKEIFVLSARRGRPGRFIHCVRQFAKGQCVCGRAAETGEVVFDSVAHKNPTHICFPESFPAHADLAVPLKNQKGKVLGVWHAVLLPGTELADAVVHLLSYVGVMVGTALDNALRFKALSDWNEDLKAELVEKEKAIEDLTVAHNHAKGAKTDFLISMNHELRTPLNPIIGFSQVLLGEYFGPLNKKQKEHVQDILESGKRLLDLIDEILDLARVEVGQEELQLSSVSVCGIVDGMLKLVREKAFRHSITLEVRMPEEISRLEIPADEKKLKTVLFNILSNAVKFTPDGGKVVIGAHLAKACVDAGEAGAEDGPEHHDWVHFYIQDTGMGVEKDDQEKIFHDFYQVKRGLSDKTPGTGLGLSITRRFVSMHGGRVWVESEGAGKGSRFVVALPMGFVRRPEVS